MQTPTQNKSSETKIFHLREFSLPLHIPVFVSLHISIFSLFLFYFNFCLVLLCSTKSDWQKAGVFREGCKDFF